MVVDEHADAVDVADERHGLPRPAGTRGRRCRPRPALRVARWSGGRTAWCRKRRNASCADPDRARGGLPAERGDCVPWTRTHLVSGGFACRSAPPSPPSPSAGVAALSLAACGSGSTSSATATATASATASASAAASSAKAVASTATSAAAEASESGEAAESAKSSASASASSGTYTMQDVQQHATAGDCWAVVSNNVYNLTAWENEHPGRSAHHRPVRHRCHPGLQQAAQRPVRACAGARRVQDRHALQLRRRPAPAPGCGTAAVALRGR